MRSTNCSLWTYLDFGVLTVELGEIAEIDGIQQMTYEKVKSFAESFIDDIRMLAKGCDPAV
ncbi:MAG: hypothetical protein LE169_03805 [Endomicrobium sp.]|nr:hypothetical protein [Endomicrobium sp.]